MLVYKLLGQPAIDAFASSFGVSYGLNQVTEWQDILKEAFKAIFILLILERLFLSSPVGWLEDHVDYLSVQAVLMQHKIGIVGRIRAHLRYSSRSACPRPACVISVPTLTLLSQWHFESSLFV
jgi:hypothetical protein